MSEIETLEIIRQNIKTHHMAVDMWDGTTSEERAAYREQFAVMTKAIAALREQQEREKGCEHCRGWDKRCGASFCPMCGRPL